MDKIKIHTYSVPHHQILYMKMSTWETMPRLLMPMLPDFKNTHLE